MTRADVDSFCAAYPGAVLSGPGELDSWKVGGKMFVCYSGEAKGDAVEGSQATGFSVKTPSIETATMLIETGVGEVAAYFHRSWVRLPFAAIDPNEAAHRIAVSFDTIRAGLTAKVRATLPDPEAT